MSDQLKAKTMGIVILVITVSVCIVFVASVLIPLYQNLPMSDTRASIIEGVMMALIGLIGIYIGSEIRGKNP